MSVQKLLDRLDKVKTCPGRHPSNWKACCPSHDDSDPSLSISETADGNVLIKCWAGCTGADVMEAVGMEWHEILPERLLNKPERRPVASSSQIDKDITESLGHMEKSSHERLVLDYAKALREQGVRLSDEDLKRERLAFERTRASAA